MNRRFQLTVNVNCAERNTTKSALH